MFEDDDMEVEIDGKTFHRLRPEGFAQRITPLDCGRWCGYEDGLTMSAILIRRAQEKGMNLSELEEAVVTKAVAGEIEGHPLEDVLVERAFDYVNSNAPEGFRIGFKMMDVWFMPAQWWEATGGEE